MQIKSVNKQQQQPQNGIHLNFYIKRLLEAAA